MAYELRDYEGEPEEYSNSAKYALSMAISAIDGDKMSEEDKNAVEAKLDAKFDQNEDEESVEDDNIGDSLATDDVPTDSTDVQSEAIILSKGALMESLNLINERHRDPLHMWALSTARKFNKGFIKSSKQLIDIIENLIESFDIEVDREKLYSNLESKLKQAYKTSSKITPELLLDIVENSIERKVFFDEDYDIYDVDSDDLLFDLEEDAYGVELPKIKNREFVQDYLGSDIGRIEGDDDYIEQPTTIKKRNPFKYYK